MHQFAGLKSSLQCGRLPTTKNAHLEIFKIVWMIHTSAEAPVPSWTIHPVRFIVLHPRMTDLTPGMVQTLGRYKEATASRESSPVKHTTQALYPCIVRIKIWVVVEDEKTLVIDHILFPKCPMPREQRNKCSRLIRRHLAAPFPLKPSAHPVGGCGGIRGAFRLHLVQHWNYAQKVV